MDRTDPPSSWRVTAAEAQGSSHEATQTPCQDAHRWLTLDNGWMVAAVADGAGSSSLAEVGAAAAVGAAVETVAARLPAHLATGKAGWHEFMRGVLGASLNAVLAVAAARGREARDLASTLLVVVIGPAVTVAAQIGDGAIVYQRDDASIHMLTGPESPSECINEAVFLVSSRSIAGAAVAVVPRAFH